MPRVEQSRLIRASHKLWPLALQLTCALYFIAAISTIIHSRVNNFSTNGVTKSIPGPELNNGGLISYSFPEYVQKINDLVLFIEEQSYRTSQGTELTITLHGSSTISREILIGTSSDDYRVRQGNLVALTLNDVKVSSRSDSAIKLTLSLAEGFEGASPRFYLTQRFLPSDSLVVNGQPISHAHLMLQTHYVDFSRLAILIAAGIVALFVSLLAICYTRFHIVWVLLATLGLAVCLAELGWQTRLQEFYGWFWPDRYVEYAAVLKRWFIGQLSWQELIDYTSTFRNAQAWLVPAFVATLNTSGLSYVLSYSILNILALAAMVGTWMLLFMRRFPESQPIDRALFMVAISLHYLHLSVGTSLLTDALACSFVGLFFLFFYPIIDNSANNKYQISRRSILLSAGALSLVVQTRIAMVPLMLAPVALAAWLAARSNFMNIKIEPAQLVSIAVTVTLAVGLTVLTYTIFNLYESIFLAKKFAEKFSSNNFNLGFFASHVNNLLMPAYVALLLARFSTLRDNTYSLIWIYIVGYLCMLFIGQIPSWPRYLAPLAAPVVFYCLSVAKEKSDSALFYRTCSLLLIGYHLVHFLFLVSAATEH